MPEERGSSGDAGACLCGVVTCGVGQPARQEDGCEAFAAVAQQGDQGEVLAAGAQDVGRADVSRAHLADVSHAAEARSDHAKGDRAQEVAADQGGRDIGPERWHGQVLSCRPEQKKPAAPATSG